MNHAQAKATLAAIARDMQTSAAGYVRRQGRRVQEALDVLIEPDMGRMEREMAASRIAFEAGYRAAENGENLFAAWRRIMLGDVSRPTDAGVGP